MTDFRAQAEQIVAIAATPDQVAFLRVNRYFIGDQAEAMCVATGLTVSAEHLTGAQVVDDSAYGVCVQAKTYFPAAMVPVDYRDQVNERGVVEITITVPMADCQPLVGV